MKDPTESLRREMIESRQPQRDLAEALDKNGEIWNTETLHRDFEVIGFLAPFCIVRRKSDGKRGTLEFTHVPRYYFNWTDGDEAP